MAVFTTRGAAQPVKLAVKLKKSYPEAKWHKPLNVEWKPTKHSKALSFADIHNNNIN